LNGGEISSSTSTDGNGGNVNVIADGSLLIDGACSGIFADAIVDTLVLNVIEGTGNAGNVTVQAGNLTIANGGEISSSTTSLGNGGTVGVMADSLLIGGANSGIFAIAGSGSNGDAGSLVVHARDLAIINGGQISSSTFGKGNGGNVDVAAASLLIN